MRFLAIIGCVLALSGCDHKPSPDTLVIGTIAGPETELVEVAKAQAFKDKGLRVKIVEFSDYNLPNEALVDQSLDANVFQHLPYLKKVMRARGYPFEIFGRTFIYPMGLYSAKFKTVETLPNGATIAIPNDPSNEARALKLLQQAHLITLKHKASPSLDDIRRNPKQLVFKSIDAAQLPRILPDVDGAVINTTFAIPSGLSPSRDALFLETKDSPYANLIVIRQDSPKKAQLKQFVEAMHSTAVKEKAKTLFGDGAIPAW